MVIKRSRKRARRGMTVFVVMLVIMMLSAVGIFAARASQLGVSNSGRYRAMLQTHFIAEGGMHGAITEFSRDPSGYLTMLKSSPSPSAATTAGFPCLDIPFQSSAPTFNPASNLCLRLGLGALRSAAIASGAPTGGPTPFNVFAPAVVDPGTGVTKPGSLGRGNVAGNFIVEFTDERPVDVAPPGTPLSVGPGASLKFKSITARAMGQVVPADSAGAPLAMGAAGSRMFVTSVETIRAEVMIGPVP